MMTSPSNISRVIGHSVWGIVCGVLAALMTLVLAMVIHPVVALAVPLILVLGLLLATRPVAGALLLVFFSYLDGISDMIFSVSPVSGFKLITAATFIGIAVTAHRHRSHLLYVFRSPITLWVLAFGFAWVVAILFADNRAQAISWGLRLGTIKVLFYLLVMSLITQSHITLGISCLAFASAISAVFLILDTFLGITLISSSEAATTARTAEGFDRSSGASQSNPTTAATMLLCGTVIALVHAIETPKWRGAMTAMAVLGSLAIVLSFARSAALVYAIILLFLAVRFGSTRFFAPISVLALIAVIAMIPFVPPSYFERITSIFGGGGGDWTLGRRMTYNVIGIDLLASNPIFGIGPGNFYLRFTDPEYRYLPGRTLLGRQLHNMYLSVAVEYGMVGFTFFAGMIISAFRLVKSVVRDPANDELRALAVALFYGMLAYYIVSVFVPNEYNKYTWLLPALSCTLGIVNKRLLDQKGA